MTRLYPHHQIGQQAEKSALSFLKQQGLTLLTKNFHCRCGEIDLIMKDHYSLVFIEVRFRRSPAFGGAAASITHKKQQRLLRSAQYYLQQYSSDTLACRFDVLAFDQDLLEPDWIQNAF